ncbi:putative prenylated Rab acceptor 1 [Rosellinia necatrix]|uniref:Putative prenylated Rab acceptor 1 n=1 Tax=Rosellinia necatrix TaxID=77044 RepID=A0A1S8A8I8_ROSNE|nr:putative prenylated Rab acceptor 1 [Rosellinia necatrix]
MGGGRSRNKYAYQHSDDDNDLTESDSQATTDEETEDDARAEMENALVQSALARIRKARARGRQDVKLNKGEVAALERRRKRLEAEAARKKGADGRKRKDKEQRVAVPISQFDAPSHSSSSAMVRSQGPPVGMFPPPNTPQGRPRSSASSHSLRSSFQRHGSSSPFDYQYVSTSSNRRHGSDTLKHSSSLKALPHEEDQGHDSPSPHTGLDPFQYQTSEPYETYVERMPEDDERGNDGHEDDAYPDHGTGQEDTIVVETEEQELRSSKGKRTTSRNSSPGKRKSSSRRRRDK